MSKRFLFLSELRPAGDLALFLLRALVAAFILWTIWPRVSSAGGLAEFAEFLTQFNFPAPGLMAPLSGYVQLFCGLAFLLGLFTRWAGFLCAFNFAVAAIMVDMFRIDRAVFPSAVLVVIGLYLATNGPGRFSLDAALLRTRTP